MTIKGKIKVINPTEQVSEKFSKREFVVTTEDIYPQDILIQFTQDKCRLLDLFKVGNNVEVAYNLKGKEYTDKNGNVRYFTSIEGWKINNLDKPQHNGGLPNETVATQVETEQVNAISNEEEDSLPF